MCHQHNVRCKESPPSVKAAKRPVQLGRSGRSRLERKHLHTVGDGTPSHKEQSTTSPLCDHIKRSIPQLKAGKRPQPASLFVLDVCGENPCFRISILFYFFFLDHAGDNSSQRESRCVPPTISCCHLHLHCVSHG